MDFLAWLENLPLSTWVREANTIWAYPTVLVAHTIGLGYVVGISAAIDLRILGFAPRIPLEPLRGFFRYLWWGFWLNAISGVALTMAGATQKVLNPVFWVKLAFIAVAVALVPKVERLLDANPPPSNSKLLATGSLIAWGGAIVAGRLMAYIGNGKLG
jgi:hypothetical protein